MIPNWTIVKGKHKHKQAYFIKYGNTFIAKTYGHQQQNAQANAQMIINALKPQKPHMTENEPITNGLLKFASENQY